MRPFSTLFVATVLGSLAVGCGSSAPPAGSPAGTAEVTPAALCDHWLPLVEKMKADAKITPGDPVKMKADCLTRESAEQKADPAKFQRVASCKLKAKSGADLEACEKL